MERHGRAAPLLGSSSTATYTSGTQTYVVPAGVPSLRVTAIGASDGNYTIQTAYAPGARVTAIVPVSPGETLIIVVGGQGASGNATNAGGTNGGGSDFSNSNSTVGGAGGTPTGGTGVASNGGTGVPGANQARLGGGDSGIRATGGGS